MNDQHHGIFDLARLVPNPPHLTSWPLTWLEWALALNCGLLDDGVNSSASFASLINPQPSIFEPMDNYERPNPWAGMDPDKANLLKQEMRDEWLRIKDPPNQLRGIERDQMLWIMGYSWKEIEDMTGFKWADFPFHCSQTDEPDLKYVQNLKNSPDRYPFPRSQTDEPDLKDASI